MYNRNQSPARRCSASKACRAPRDIGASYTLSLGLRRRSLSGAAMIQNWARVRDRLVLRQPARPPKNQTKTRPFVDRKEGDSRCSCQNGHISDLFRHQKQGDSPCHSKTRTETRMSFLYPVAPGTYNFHPPKCTDFRSAPPRQFLEFVSKCPSN